MSNSRISFCRLSTSRELLATTGLILVLLYLYVQMKYSANKHLDRSKRIQIFEQNDLEQVDRRLDITDQQKFSPDKSRFQMDSCFNYSMCPIFTEISYKLIVYYNNPEEKVSSSAEKSLTVSSNSTESPCLAILFVSRCQKNIPKLTNYFAQKTEVESSNYIILVSCPEISDFASILFELRKIPELERAIFVSPVATKSAFNKGYDIVSTFLQKRAITVSVDTPASKRTSLINFDETCFQHHNHSMHLLGKELTKQYRPGITVSACGTKPCEQNCKKRCRSRVQNAMRISVFTVISLPKDEEVLSTMQLQQKLFQILRYGSIPVVIGLRFLPPFEEIIDWTQIIVRIPEPRIMQITKILKSYSQVVQEAMQRQGKLVFNQHFRSSDRVKTAAVAVIASRLSFSGIYYVPGNSDQGHRSPVNSNAERTANLTISNHIPHTSTWFVPEPSLQTTTHLWDRSFHQHYKSAKSNSSLDKFTIVLHTFNRVKELTKLLVYLMGLDQVDKIVIAWSSKIPKNFTWWPSNLKIPIHAIQMDKDSLNNHFYPFDAIETDAVLCLHDDTFISNKDLLFGFRVWQENQNRLVGYKARSVSTKDGKKWTYKTRDCPVSIILTSCAFVHKMYLVYYTFQVPKSIRETVDKLMNCEDIAMNFLVSHLSQKPPIKIEDKTFGCSNCSSAPHSLWLVPRHFEKRNQCVTQLSKVYGYTPLFNTHLFFKNGKLDVLPGCKT